MIDTNIFDKLVCDSFYPDMWTALESKKMQFITTEIQEQEIARLPNSHRKKLYKHIPRSVIALDLQAESAECTADQLIANTAADSCDIFVTEDKALRRWFEQQYPEHLLFSYQDLRVWFIKTILPTL